MKILKLLWVFCFLFPIFLNAQETPQNLQQTKDPKIEKQKSAIWTQRQQGNASLGLVLGGGIALNQTAIAIDGERIAYYSDNTYEIDQSSTFNAGLLGQYFFINNFSLSFNLYYDYRRIGFDYKEPSGQIRKKGSYNFHLVSFDLGLRYYLSFLFIGAGGSISLPFKGSLSFKEWGATAAHVKEFPLDPDALKLHWGGFAELGLDFRFGKHSSFSLSAQYHIYPKILYQDDLPMDTDNGLDDTKLKKGKIHPLNFLAGLHFYF